MALPALVALALLISGALYQSSGFFPRLDQRTVDLRFRNLPDATSQPDSDIVLVEIDDASIAELEELVGRWPWPRMVHAFFLDYMTAAQARLVIFDIAFRERQGTDTAAQESDQLFVEATRAAGNVVHVLVPLLQQLKKEFPAELAARYSIPARGRFDPYPEMDGPFDGLWQAARSLGHVAFALDPDGAWRRYQVMAEFQNRLYPSLSLAAALVLNNLNPSDIEIGEREIRSGNLHIPLDRDWRLPIWYNGGSGSYSPAWEKDGRVYRGYSYQQILFSQNQIDQGEKPLLPPELFKDKVVIVGLTAEGLHDLFTTPYSGGSDESGSSLGKMSGAEIHAHVLDSILHNRYLRPVPDWASVLLAALLAAVAVGACIYLRLSLAATTAILAVVGYLLLAQWVFEIRIQVPVVSVVLSWITGLALGLSYQYWVEGREKRQVKQTFSRFVSRDVYQKLVEDPRSADLGGRRSTVTVLFSDLRGFTSMSEGREPEEIVSQLNEYFSAMVEIVFAHQGTVDKFVGDMIMALFNTPLPDPDHADHAVTCAIEMNRKLDQMNLKWKAEGKPELAQGIGINSGEMVAGVVGAETVRSYTVIGDNVNLGARLESLCKQYHAEIIISEFTRSLLKRDYPMQELGAAVVKGKSKAVKIYRVFYQEGAVSRPALKQDDVMVQTQK